MNVNDDSITIDGGGTRQAGLTRPLQFTLQGLAILVIGVAIGAVEGQIDHAGMRRPGAGRIKLFTLADTLV